MTDNSKPFRLIDLDELDSDVSTDVVGGDSNTLPPVVSHRPRRRMATEPVEKIDLNTATVEELEELPGVGPLRARRIIAWRNRNGSFESLHDLTYVRGMGARSVQDLAPYLRVGEDDEFRGF